MMCSKQGWHEKPSPVLPTRFYTVLPSWKNPEKPGYIGFYKKKTIKLKKILRFIESLDMIMIL